MGADLILVCFGTNKDANLDDACFNMLNAVKTLDMSERNEIISYYFNVKGEEIENINLEEVRKEFSDVIEEVFLGIKGTYRDIAYIYWKEDIIYITGGMSWGDTPTESYNSFYSFICLPKRILEAGKIIV